MSVKQICANSQGLAWKFEPSPLGLFQEPLQNVLESWGSYANMFCEIWKAYCGNLGQLRWKPWGPHEDIAGECSGQLRGYPLHFR